MMRIDSKNMNHRISRIISVIAILVFVSGQLSGYTQEELQGIWIHKTGPTLFESMELALEEEEHVFRSWLHDRPFAFGEWKLDKDVVLVTLSDESTIEWQVITLDSKQLQVQEKGEDSNTIYLKQE